jgi:hypothetical protein
MWAQLIRMRLRSGAEQDLPGLMAAFNAAEQPDSGLLRTMTMHDQADPLNVYTFVVFESEEKARLREQDPRRTGALTDIGTKMAEMFDGPAEFTNLTVTFEA